MRSRHLVILAVFLVLAATPYVLDDGVPAADASEPRTLVTAAFEADRALRDGRSLRANLLLGDYLMLMPEPMPLSRLLAARGDAGGDGRGTWGGETDLARYLTMAADTTGRERALAELRRARELFEAGELAGADAAYTRAGEHFPQLGDWIHVFAAEAAASAGDTATVRERLDATDPELAREWGWRIRVRAYRRAGDLAGAATVAAEASRELRDASARAAALARLGDIRLDAVDSSGARAAYRSAMAAAPGAAGAVDAARALSSFRGLTPAEQLQIGRLYVRHGNLERGIAGLQAFLESGAASAEERAVVRLELGRALFRKGDYAAAERTLLRASNEGAPAGVAADALYEAGRAQYRQGRVDEGQRTLLSVARLHPNEAAAARAVYLVADLDHDALRMDRARERYRIAAAAAPEVSEAGLARMRLGGIAFAEGDLAGAAEVYEDYIRRFPEGRRIEQALYWAGRAHLDSGRREQALERFREVRRRGPLSYYGMRAAELLGSPIHDFVMEVSPPVDPETQRQVGRAMDRLDFLAELGRRDAADFEVVRIQNRFRERDGFLYAVAEAFNERGHTMTGVRIGREIHRTEGVWNPRLLRIVHPFPYREIVLAESRARGLDPYLVAGLIRQESMFVPAIKSSAGAVGLMQIMPPTGTGLAARAGISPFRLDMLESPEVNVKLGTLYLKDLLERFDGRLPRVLAAYNAGPNRVVRWRQFPEFADDELFAERIPYAETREYVKTVQANARLYHALYAPDSPIGAP